MRFKIEIKSDIRLQHLLNTERKIWTINVESCDLGQKLEHWNSAVSSTLKDCKDNAGNRGLSRSALCWEVTVLTDSTLSQCPWAQNSDCHIQKDNQVCPLNISSHAFSVFSYLCFVFFPPHVRTVWASKPQMKFGWSCIMITSSIVITPLGPNWSCIMITWILKSYASIFT